MNEHETIKDIMVSSQSAIEWWGGVRKGLKELQEKGHLIDVMYINDEWVLIIREEEK